MHVSEHYIENGDKTGIRGARFPPRGRRYPTELSPAYLRHRCSDCLVLRAYASESVSAPPENLAQVGGVCRGEVLFQRPVPRLLRGVGCHKEGQKDRISQDKGGGERVARLCQGGQQVLRRGVCVGEEVVGFIMCQGATSTDECFIASGHGSSKSEGKQKLAHRNLADLEWLKTESDPSGQWKGVMQHASSYIVEQIKFVGEFAGIMAVVRASNDKSNRLAEAAGLQRRGHAFHVSRELQGPFAVERLA